MTRGLFMDPRDQHQILEDPSKFTKENKRDNISKITLSHFKLKLHSAPCMQAIYLAAFLFCFAFASFLLFVFNQIDIDIFIAWLRRGRGYVCLAMAQRTARDTLVHCAPPIAMHICIDFGSNVTHCQH